MLTFLKLGGSLITDKAQRETIRPDLIARASREIANALNKRPDMSLLIGHGSGSFGHAAATQYGTHSGVTSADGWRGFARVAMAAAKLDQIVQNSLDEAGVPVFRIQPSASAVCAGGQLIEMAVRPLEMALKARLVPLIYGDVSLDVRQGGSIVSTEAIFAYLAPKLRPQTILLIGDYDGVRDGEGRIVPMITRASLPELARFVGDSEWTDVTGGMASKVQTMLALCQRVPGLIVRILPGSEPGQIEDALTSEGINGGTRISA